MCTPDEARDMLINDCKLTPGAAVYTILRHVSASGMTRWISPLVVQDGKPREFSWLAAKLTGRRANTRNHYGIECGGAGMDMGFELVYAISRRLYPDGFDCIQYTLNGADLAAYGDQSRRCPSNDHTNGLRGFAHHRDGGYALQQEWL